MGQCKIWWKNSDEKVDKRSAWVWRAHQFPYPHLSLSSAFPSELLPSSIFLDSSHCCWVFVDWSERLLPISTSKGFGVSWGPRFLFCTHRLSGFIFVRTWIDVITSPAPFSSSNKRNAKPYNLTQNKSSLKPNHNPPNSLWCLEEPKCPHFAQTSSLC